jgi:hypothetical protein
VSTVSGFSAAGVVDEAKERSDDEHFPVTADGQDPLEVGDGRRHGDLVGHNDLAHHVELVVREFGNLSNNSITIKARFTLNFKFIK